MDSYLATRTNRTFGLKGGRKLTACTCGAGPSALIMSFCRAFSFLYGVQVLGHREADPATIFLQTDLALRAKVAQKWSLGKGWDPSDSETFPDVSGWYMEEWEVVSPVRHAFAGTFRSQLCAAYRLWKPQRLRASRSLVQTHLSVQQRGHPVTQISSGGWTSNTKYAKNLEDWKSQVLQDIVLLGVWVCRF